MMSRTRMLLHKVSHVHAELTLTNVVWSLLVYRVVNAHSPGTLQVFSLRTLTVYVGSMLTH